MKKTLLLAATLACSGAAQAETGWGGRLPLPLLAHHQNALQTHRSAAEHQTIYRQHTPIDRPVTA